MRFLDLPTEISSPRISKSLATHNYNWYTCTLINIEDDLKAETENEIMAAQDQALQTIYSVILSVPDPRKCEYLKNYSLDFEHAYMTTYLAS